MLISLNLTTARLLNIQLDTQYNQVFNASILMTYFYKILNHNQFG